VNLAKEVARRRTFAIISHPDAGKTTLTEKLLLYGGAVQLAGSVTARKSQRSTTSDWMELERKRGISVSSTALQFDYRDYVINLLDTPGHKDFSEDTYRVLTAVDAVVMVLDAAKGLESQTLKLFEICRNRQIPIITFVNKMDRPAKEPLELLDEIERTLQLHVCPINWPLGAGPDFRGVFDRRGRQAYYFERVPGGSYRAPVAVLDLADAEVSRQLGDALYRQVLEEVSVLDGAGEAFDRAAVLRGDQTAVFFGSAVNNFGVQLLLDGFLELAPPPGTRKTVDGEIAPDDPRFSGFVFKIQSNMDPRHRDQVAFVRVCSGLLERDMKVFHPRTGATVRLSSSHKLFGRERETVDEAFAGDVVGLVGHPEFGIGDTLTADPAIVHLSIPTFAPEHFAFLHCPNASKSKRFRAGLDHLLQEGVVQTFALNDAGQRLPLLGAVGLLQFEVLQHRLLAEYGADSRLELTSWKAVRWIAPGQEAALEEKQLMGGVQLARDARGNLAILFQGEWECQYFSERNTDVALSRTPP